MSLFLTGSYNVRVRCKISHGASVRWLCAIVRLVIRPLTSPSRMRVGVSRCPGSFAEQLDPRLMFAKDYTYISSSIN